MEEAIEDLKNRVALLEKAVGILMNVKNDLPVITIRRGDRSTSQEDRKFMEYYNALLDELSYPT